MQDGNVRVLVTGCSLFRLPLSGTLRQIIHVFYQLCVRLSAYFINPASSYPRILSTLHHLIHVFYQLCVRLSMYLPTLRHLIHIFYQPCHILSMRFINPASSHPCILSTLRHLIHVFYQACVVLSMYIINRVSDYPCILPTLHHLIHVFTNPASSYPSHLKLQFSFTVQNFF